MSSSSFLKLMFMTVEPSDFFLKPASTPYSFLSDRLYSLSSLSSVPKAVFFLPRLGEGSAALNEASF